MSFSEFSRWCKAGFMSTRTLAGTTLTRVPIVLGHSEAPRLLHLGEESCAQQQKSRGDPRQIPIRRVPGFAGNCAGQSLRRLKTADLGDDAFLGWRRHIAQNQFVLINRG